MTRISQITLVRKDWKTNLAQRGKANLQLAETVKEIKDQGVELVRALRDEFKEKNRKILEQYEPTAPFGSPERKAQAAKRDAAQTKLKLDHQRKVDAALKSFSAKAQTKYTQAGGQGAISFKPVGTGGDQQMYAELNMSIDTKASTPSVKAPAATSPQAALAAQGAGQTGREGKYWVKGHYRQAQGKRVWIEGHWVDGDPTNNAAGRKPGTQEKR